LQHTASTQKPSSQSLSTAQTDPSLSFPQLLARQGCPSQSVLAAQVLAHWVSPVLHRNGAHDSGVPALQVPIPSQRDATTVLRVGSQLAALQT
jgi:hypothetical protein